LQANFQNPNQLASPKSSEMKKNKFSTKYWI
jgi:hypothetical protein